MKTIGDFLKNNKTLVFVVPFILLLIVCAWLYLFWFLKSNFELTELNKWGVFGDSFNIITSLFTGLAFAGVIVSVILQTQELKLQREELKETKDELKGQKEQLAKQARHLEEQKQEMVIQSFDNKFFQMLNLFNTNINNLKINNSNIMEVAYPYHNGKKVLSVLKQELITRINVNLDPNLITVNRPNMEDNKIIGMFQELFQKFNQENSNTFKYYCINLYQILKYIDENTPKESLFTNVTKMISTIYAYSKDDRQLRIKGYANIIRAQLSTDELILLMYNAIGVIPFSGEKYKELLEEYAFLEHLSVEYLEHENIIRINDILKQYNKKIAGKNKKLENKIERLQKNKIT